MVERSFFHIPHVGQASEVRLWTAGCHDWDCFESDPSAWPVTAAQRDSMKAMIGFSRDALAAGDHKFFSEAMPGEIWRTWPSFRDRVCYLDIETDGGFGGDSITVIGLYDGFEFRCLVKGQDLDEFPDLIADRAMFVTFFGSGFDIPMLKKRFPQLPFDQLHLDLCPAFRKVGLKGGLKKIEVELGIDRGEETYGLDGRDAIRLWNSYRYGREGALERLIAYNREDVVNMEALAQIAYERLARQTLEPAGLGHLASGLIPRPRVV